MEILASTQARELRNLASFSSVAEMWLYALSHVNQHRIAEVNAIWEKISQRAYGFTEHAFMQEYTWAVHVSGYSAKVVGKKFKAILQAHNIEDRHGCYIPITVENIIPADQLETKVYPVWRNRAKAMAVQKTRRMILERSWESLYLEIRHHGLSAAVLRQFPFMGPTLACHLARNLGSLEAVKPDKHLLRLAERYRCSTPEELCRQCPSLAPLGWRDLVLWVASVDCGTKETSKFLPAGVSAAVSVA